MLLLSFEGLRVDQGLQTSLRTDQWFEDLLTHQLVGTPRAAQLGDRVEALRLATLASEVLVVILGGTGLAVLLLPAVDLLRLLLRHLALGRWFVVHRARSRLTVRDVLLLELLLPPQLLLEQRLTHEVVTLLENDVGFGQYRIVLEAAVLRVGLLQLLVLLDVELLEVLKVHLERLTQLDGDLLLLLEDDLVVLHVYFHQRHLLGHHLLGLNLIDLYHLLGLNLIDRFSHLLGYLILNQTLVHSLYTSCLSQSIHRQKWCHCIPQARSR